MWEGRNSCSGGSNSNCCPAVTVVVAIANAIANAVAVAVAAVATAFNTHCLRLLFDIAAAVAFATLDSNCFSDWICSPRLMLFPQRLSL